ncbi:hypothetical protein L6452_01005 [Arctium lappa]|uniref:Uncharacterized protein n=1 Tax=Arctium lappa TaxID=4217 RepID=A0ACB9FGB7_ARCLA|nr:hypothetical protein L6452_01005 [Arctium lappa]
MAQSSIVAFKHVRFAITEVEITKCNHLGRLDFKADKYPHLVEAAEFLKQSCIAYAITVDPKPSKTLLQQFWFSADATELTNKKGERVPAISFSTDLGPGSMTALSLRKSLRFPDKPKSGFDALPTDAELISFLDAMGYCWKNKPRSSIPNKKLTKILKAQMPSQLNFIFSHIIQCMNGKSGSLDQASKTQLQMAYSVIAGQNFDYATAIFEDLRSRLEKPEQDPKISYVRFICTYIKFLYPNTYPTKDDGTFARIGQRSMEVKPLANEVSISLLHSRLSLHSSSFSATTQTVPSSAIPVATTTSKRPSASSIGPSKKAKKTKENTPSSTIPEGASQQATLDAFVGLSSTTPEVTQPTVSAISIVVTSSVTPPTISFAEINPNPTSIPINLLSPPLVSEPATSSLPIGPEHQTFEESLQFYKMFDTSGKPIILNTSFPTSSNKPVSELISFSGPSLASVDTHVNSLGEKVDALTNTINNTTTVVNQAGEELKRLTATCSSKAENSQLSAVEEQVVQLRESSQLFQGRFESLTTEVRDLSSKVDLCTSLLQQLLQKVTAPAPALPPSFTEDDRTNLNIVVEFIHDATCDIPAVEDRVRRLEADVQVLKASTATPAADQPPVMMRKKTMKRKMI